VKDETAWEGRKKMDPSPESKQGKDEDLSKVDLKYSSRSFLAILIGFILAVLLITLSFLTLFTGGGDVMDPVAPLFAVLSIIISGIVAFATSLSGIMKCGRLLYEYPALKKDIVNEIYANLSVILGIVFVVLLFAKYIKRGFFFFF
jgi:hypothetical protein